jgi:hypothetical protein
MAELLVRKKSRPVWPIILFALLLLGLVAWFVLRNNPDALDTNNNQPAQTTTNGAATTPSGH